MTMATVNTQDPMKAGAAVNEFVKKYENVKDVDCMTISKRSGPVTDKVYGVRFSINNKTLRL